MADAMGAHLCPETSPQPSLHPACADTRASCLRAICPYKMLWERSPCALLPNPAHCKGKTQAWVKLHRCKTLTFAVDCVEHQMCYYCDASEKLPLLTLHVSWAPRLRLLPAPSPCATTEMVTAPLPAQQERCQTPPTNPLLFSTAPPQCS